MTSATGSTYFALHPGLRLKNDVDRAVLITRPAPLAVRSYICRRLPPAEAVVLSLMNGRRTLDEVISLWSAVTSKDEAKAREEIDVLITFYTTGERRDEQILLASEQPIVQAVEYDPFDFVIPIDRVNLSERRLRLPVNVYFLTTLYCPQNCIYCYAKVRKTRESDLLPLDRVKSIMSELATLGVESIQFSGGDALARPGIFDIVEYVHSLGMVADIPTKIGLGFAKARRLARIGVKIVQFSLDCVDPDTLDFMVGVEAYHEKAFRALDNLRDAGLSVRVNTVLTPYNIDQAAALIRYAGDLGNVVRLSFTPYGRSLFKHRDDLFVDEGHLDRLESVVAALSPRYPHMTIVVGGAGSPPPADPEERQRNWAGRAFCTANRDSFVILPDGRVTACEELYDHPAFIIGDLRRQSVMEMWNSREAFALLHPPRPTDSDSPCADCATFEDCNAGRGRCWRDVLKSYGWGKPDFPDPRCARASAGNRLG